jgi:hypothetical protein
MAGDRSPNYPIISLADAVGRIQQIYDKERTHPADKEVIAKALGYGSLNGLSRSILSALIKYELLTEDGADMYKVSNDALDILLRSSGQPERVGAITKAAFGPQLFSELRGQFGTSLPSDENLKAYLVKRGFNPNTVNNVIRSYRDTVEYVNQEARFQDGELAPNLASAPAAEAAATATTPRSTVKTLGAITMLPPEMAEEGTLLAFQLTSDCHAKIVLTGNVTQEAIEKLYAFLDLSKDTFPRRADVEVRDEINV